MRPEIAERTLVTLTRRLVAVDSQNPGATEAEVGREALEIASELGFEGRTLEAEPGRTNVLIDVDAGPGSVLGFSAHLDTKPVGRARAQWRTDPLELVVENGLAYGLGASDMKGAVAAILVAAQEWARGAANGRLRLILTADEEAGGTRGAEYLARAGFVDADAIVVCEPCGAEESWESIQTVSRGLMCFQVHLSSQQGHSGLSDRLGCSAAVAAARVIDAFTGFQPPVCVDADPTAPTVTTTVNTVAVEVAGEFGVHPGMARVSTEIRLVPGMAYEPTRAAVEDLLSEAVPDDVSWSVTPDADLAWKPASSIASSHVLVAACMDAYEEVIGRAARLAACPGGTDAGQFTRFAGIPSVAALGPGLLSVAHGPNEYVPVDDLIKAQSLYVSIANRYTHQSSVAAG